EERAPPGRGVPACEAAAAAMRPGLELGHAALHEPLDGAGSDAAAVLATLQVAARMIDDSDADASLQECASAALKRGSRLGLAEAALGAAVTRVARIRQAGTATGDDLAALDGLRGQLGDVLGF
ncbi:hypothetical protein, partial [Nonomuraea recticatena]|uniref:hypothetical protein n=1 Tax=Nonomuraea recticatena TaxID=46178 RepID=UPI0031F9D4A9